MNNKNTKCITMLVIVAIIVGVVCNKGFIKSKANEVTNEQENLVKEQQLPRIGEEIGAFNENGIDYVVTLYEEGDSQYSQVIDTNGETRKDIIFTNNKKYLKVIEYEKVSEESDNIIYKEVNCKSVNLENLANKIENELSKRQQPLTRYTWDKKQFDGYKGDMWFSDGKSGYGNDYLRIGCKATYRIPIYKFKTSSDKYKKCKAYTDSIIATQKIMLKLTAKYGMAFISTCLAAVSTGGLGALVTIGGSAIDLYDTYKSMKPHYDKAVKNYNIIKHYGECE